MIVEYHPAVETELDDVRAYYEKRLPGLGAEFIEEFERQILNIAASPKRWAVTQHDIRRALLKRLPYVIYYRQVSPDRIRMTVVKHQRRHPSYGLNRV